jgi:hypothetical protein
MRTDTLLSRAPAGLAALALVGLCACQPSTRVELVGGTAELAATAPELIDEMQSVVAVVFYNFGGENACAELVDAPLDDIAAREPFARQAVPLEDTVGLGHTFGNIGASGDYSFLLLGSFRETGALLAGADPILAARGSVIAIGCEEQRVLQNYRYDLPITLFPAGVR